MSLFRLLIIILALYLVLTLFFRYIAPLLLKLFIRKVQKDLYNQSRDKREDRDTEGKVSIKKMNNNKENEIPPDLGEYIDYEEVNNNQNPTDE